MASPYRDLILELLHEIGELEDPQVIENWIRVEHSALDRLSRDQFRREVIAAVQCERIRVEMCERDDEDAIDGLPRRRLVS